MDTADDFTSPDPMAAYLSSIARDACYRVDRVLKTSATETTELVFFVGENQAELGPFVRKRFDRSSGTGTAYRSLYEAQCAGRRFRHLPRVFDVHEAGEQLVVVMEYIPGDTLRALVDKTPASERLHLAAQVMPALCLAAAELHEGLAAPVVHRDLTPSNVMCSPEYPSNLTLIDLGISRTYRPGASSDTAYFGTRAYAPPEQYGFGQTTPRTDVYALGMTFFYCLAGREATNADRARGFGLPGVPETVSAVIAHACDLSPEARYASAAELAVTLQDVFSAAERELAAPVKQGPRNPVLAACGGFLTRVPLWVGDLWNVALIGMAAFMAIACFVGFTAALSESPGVPGWYLFYEYIGFVLLDSVLIAYALLDKRRLRREYGWMRRHAVWRERFVCLGIAAAAFVAWIVVVLVLSALGIETGA